MQCIIHVYNTGMLRDRVSNIRLHHSRANYIRAQKTRSRGSLSGIGNGNQKVENPTRSPPAVASCSIILFLFLSLSPVRREPAVINVEKSPRDPCRRHVSRAATYIAGGVGLPNTIFGFRDETWTRGRGRRGRTRKRDGCFGDACASNAYTRTRRSAHSVFSIFFGTLRTARLGCQPCDAIISFGSCSARELIELNGGR